MDKLVEREHAPRNPLVAAPALAVQFFLIPLAVVGMTVLVYVGFRSLLDRRSARGRSTWPRCATAGASRQWPAAYELSRLMEDPSVRADRSLVPDLVKAFDEAKDDDPRIRRYLALAIGRLDPPLPKEAIDVLTKTLDEPGTAVDARHRVADQRVGRHRHQRSQDHDDLGARVVGRRRRSSPRLAAALRLRRTRASARWSSTRLARCLARRRCPRCRKALKDEAADVRWNAAVALARHDNAEGVPVLRQMLDRAYRRADRQARRAGRTKTRIRLPT